MKRKGFITTTIFVLIFLLSLPSYAGSKKRMEKGPIKIGVILGLTGPAAVAGLAFSMAFKVYFRDINDQGGINGRKVKLILEDDRSAIPMAIAAFKKIVYKDKVVAFIGPGSTGSTQALFSKVQKEKVVNMTLSCAQSMFKPYKKYVFATGTPCYEEHVRTLYDYILKDLKVKNPRIAIVGADHEYSHTHLREARRCAEHYNIPLHEEVISFGALDATTQVLGLKKAKADFVILNVPPGASSAVMIDSRKFNYKPTFLGTYYCSIESTLQVAKTAAKNFIGIHNYNSWYADTPGIKKMVEITKRFEPKMDKRYLSKFYSHGWVISMLLSEGIKRTKGSLDGEGLVAGLEKIRDFDSHGIGGLISYTPDLHKASDYCMIFKSDTKNGRFIPIGTWRKPSVLK